MECETLTVDEVKRDVTQRDGFKWEKRSSAEYNCGSHPKPQVSFEAWRRSNYEFPQAALRFVNLYTSQFSLNETFH